MAITKTIGEIMNEVDTAPDEATRIHLLRLNMRFGLTEFLRGMFNPDIAFIYKTKKDIPYNWNKQPDIDGTGYSNIDRELKKAYIWVEGHPDSVNITPVRKRELFIQLVESLDAKEARWWIQMILKKSDQETLTADLVRKAFPGLIDSEHT